MARGINKVILVGNLGADPDTRYSANGNAVTRISVATSDAWKDKQTGDQQERTEWHRVVFFSRLAEIAAEYLRKGSQVYIEGTLRTSSYEKEGQKHYSTDIIAREMQMLGSRQGQGGHNLDTRDDGGSQKSSAGPSRGQSGGMDDFDDDIPF